MCAQLRDCPLPPAAAILTGPEREGLNEENQVCFIRRLSYIFFFSCKAVACEGGKDGERLSKMTKAWRQTPAGCIHHSDLGVQYASRDYVAALQQHGFQISRSRKGNPYDNATLESFFKTLKAEAVYLWEYQDLLDVRRRLGRFISAVYNRKRLPSSLGYRPPIEFEEMLENQKTACQTILT